jgi:hypothetical protein
MENDPFGNQSAKNEARAEREWSEFERDLDSLGRQLAQLQSHTATLGGHLVASLQAHFEDVKSRAASFRRAREAELEEARRSAQYQAESAFSDARARSAEAARQVWERSEPLRQGAKDVGEGLARAWVELRASFGKAAQRLQTESEVPPANGPQPVPAEQRRETTYD